MSEIANRLLEERDVLGSKVDNLIDELEGGKESHKIYNLRELIELITGRTDFELDEQGDLIK